MIKNLVYGIMVFIQLIRAAAQTDLCDCSDWLGVSTPFYSASPTFSVSLRALYTGESILGNTCIMRSVACTHSLVGVVSSTLPDVYLKK